MQANKTIFSSLFKTFRCWLHVLTDTVFHRLCPISKYSFFILFMAIVFQFIGYHMLFNKTLCDNYRCFIFYNIFALTNNAGTENFDRLSSGGSGYKMCQLD